MARKSRSSRTQYTDPALSRGIIAILLVILALIILLSFFDKAGTLGIVLDKWILSALFGMLRYFVPFGLIIIAASLFKHEQDQYSYLHILGATLFTMSLASIFHLQFPANDMWRNAVEGFGGGVIGMPAWILKTYVGTMGSIIILIGLTIISVLLLINSSLSALLSKLKSLKKKREKNDDDYYEDDEEEKTPKRGFFKTKLFGGDDDIEDEDVEDDDESEEEEEDDDDNDPEEDEEHEETTDDKEENIQPGRKSEILNPWSKQKIIIRDLPPLSLLNKRKGKPTSGNTKMNAKIINDTFREFKIDVNLGEVRIGPTVTQYRIKPPRGVKLSRITSLSNNLALNLAAHPIRIEAPIPGQSLVGIEVPNQKTAIVSLRELLESETFKTRKHNMMLALGRDVGGKVWFCDLPRMPHLLIAGATGSGKTVCINTVIMSLLYQNTAETLRMIMVDPKRVELTLYNGIPHLLTPPITNTQKTVNALKWCIGEMDRRFELLAQAGNRDITTFNKRHPDDKIPHIVFVIDELADLMATASGEIEAGIIRIAQMARAVGIHLILATQRPSVDVITGLMKANIPGRIAFSVASLVDSRTILDESGAEKLIGNGDMLYSNAELSKPTRIQGSFVSEEEVKKVVKYLKSDDEPIYDESIIEKQSNTGTMNMFGGPTDDRDTLFDDAQRTVTEAGKASTSFLQRRLRIGYARAARIMDELEEAGIIGPQNGSKPRDILIKDFDKNTSDDAGQNLNSYEE